MAYEIGQLNNFQPNNMFGIDNTNVGNNFNNQTAFNLGSPLDNQIKNLNNLEQMGFPQPNLQNLKNMDMQQFKEKGIPLSLPEDRYVNANNVLNDASQISVSQSDSPYNYYDVDRYTADEDMTYQPDVPSSTGRFSGLTNPIKTGAGILMSGLTKIPGAGYALDLMGRIGNPMTPELKAQSQAFQDMGLVDPSDPGKFSSGLMEGYNISSMFGTNDAEQMILDRIAKMNTVKRNDQRWEDFKQRRTAQLQKLADIANEAKNTAKTNLGGGWSRQNNPDGTATFSGPGGESFGGWSNTDKGIAAASASEGSFALGGRVGYNKGGRVGILSAF